MISQFLDHVGSNPNPIAMTSHSMDLVEFYLPNHTFLASQVVDCIGSNPNLGAMTSHSMELAESYLPTPTLITPQTMNIFGSNLKLAMDFNESSLSKPTLMTSPPINHIESNYHPDPTLATSQPMNHIENSMIPSILTSLHGVFHEQNPIVSQVVPFEVQPNVFYRSSITQLMATKLPQLQLHQYPNWRRASRVSSELSTSLTMVLVL